MFSCHSSNVCESAASGATGQLVRNAGRPFEDVEPETRRTRPTFEDASEEPSAAITHLPRCSFEEPEAASVSPAAIHAPTDEFVVTVIVGGEAESNRLPYLRSRAACRDWHLDGPLGWHVEVLDQVLGGHPEQRQRRSLEVRGSPHGQPVL